MTSSFENDPIFGQEVVERTLLSMMSDALGYEVVPDTVLSPLDILTAGVAVQLRLDAVTEQMRRMREGEEVNLDLLMDSKAQFALLGIDQYRRENP